MIIKLLNIIISALALFNSLSLQAAEYSNPSKKINAKIKIENTLLRTTQGQNEYVSITLVAKDNKALHKGQVYRLKALKATTKKIVDGHYNENDEVIFIDYLVCMLPLVNFFI